MKRKLKDKILLLQRIIVIFCSVGLVAFQLGSLVFKSNLVFLNLYNQPRSCGAVFNGIYIYSVLQNHCVRVEFFAQIFLLVYMCYFQIR